MTPAMALTSVASRRYGPCAIAIDMFYPLVHASGGYTFGHVAKKSLLSIYVDSGRHPRAHR